MLFKYSCTYTKINPNFCISIPNKQHRKITNEELGIFCVVKNIINRSCYTKASSYLKSILGNIKYKDNNISYKYYKSIDNLEWHNTIKGGDTTNPALNFYNIELIKDLNNDCFLKNTFIPELSFDQIIYSNDIKLKSSYVDFYSPQLKCVIEIDGIQHNKESQSLDDKERDLLLKSKGIKVIRIKSKEYATFNSQLFSLAKNYDTKCYIDDYNCTDMNYDACIRYQFTILKLLEYGYISINDKEWNFCVTQNDKIRKDIIKIAAIDLLNWINNILILCNKTTINPIINFKNNNKDNCILINLDLKNFYDEKSLNNESNIIYIRNDFFEYDKNANITYDHSNKYISFKNYYKVENGSISYKIYNKNEIQKKSLLFILKEIFGFEDFLPYQEDIICESLDRGSVIGLLPTGAGKSLCYQFVSLLLPGLTLVVSPLKVLMKDQFESMTDKFGITNICFVNSSNKKDTDIIKNYQSKITLISPERFFNDEFLGILKDENTQVSLVSIDEVHCLSEWGHDFRTSYLCLTHYLKENINKKCKLLGLTATASPRVLEDIVVEFNNFKGFTKIIQSVSLARGNLHLEVKKFDPGLKYCNFNLNYSNNNKYQSLKNIYDNSDEFEKKTIVFTKTKSKSPMVNDSCFNLAMQFKKDFNIDSNDIKVDYFASDDNNENLNDDKLCNFRSGNTRLLFSTKAFGMGVDIPDIRRTIHFALPSSIESLYQEFGRAGRDGKDSDCYIWYYQENPKLFHNLFDNDFTMDKINNVREDFKEFSTNLFFLTNQTLDVEQEKFFEIFVYNYITWTIKEKKNSFYVNDLVKDFEAKCKITYKIGYNYKKIAIIPDEFKDLYVKGFNYKAFIDKALYRLYLLGRISMWSIKYSTDMENPLISNLNITENNIEDQISHLENYIRKYEPNYVYKNESESDLVLVELIKWAFNHFVYQQVQSLKNIYEYCDDYKDSNQFMNLIVRYLSSDKQTSKLLTYPNDYSFWFKLINNTQIDELKSIISRYLESDDKLVSLNFISGLVRLKLDDYDDPDGRRRMTMAFNMIKDYPIKDQEIIINDLFDNIKSNKQKDLLVETIASIDYNFVPMIYKKYQNDLLDTEIIYKFANDIANVGGKLHDRFRKVK